MVQEVTVTGLKDARNAMSRYRITLPKAAGRIVWLYSLKAAEMIREFAKARGHKGSGYLSSKRGTHAIKLDRGTYAIKMPYYTTYLENGTRPHWIPRTGKTEMWAKRNGMSFFFMKQHIAAFGTKPHPFTQEAVDFATRNWLPRIAERQARAAIKT